MFLVPSSPVEGFVSSPITPWDAKGYCVNKAAGAFGILLICSSFKKHWLLISSLNLCVLCEGGQHKVSEGVEVKVYLQVVF